MTPPPDPAVERAKEVFRTMLALEAAAADATGPHAPETRKRILALAKALPRHCGIPAQECKSCGQCVPTALTHKGRCPECAIQHIMRHGDTD